MAEIKVLRSMHEAQIEKMAGAVERTAVMTQHAHAQKQHMMELEKENDRFEVEVHDLKLRNEVWATRFMDEVISSKAIGQQREVELDDALTALLDRDREIAAAEMRLGLQGDDLLEMRQELQILENTRQLNEDTMKIAEGSIVNAENRAQDLQAQVISNQKEIGDLRKDLWETKASLSSWKDHYEQQEERRAAEAKRLAKPSTVRARWDEMVRKRKMEGQSLERAKIKASR